MANLDDLRTIEKLDAKHMARYIRELADQLEKAALDFRAISLPTHYVQARNILILGMGGSAIGSELAMSFSQPTTKVPIEVRRDYLLPNYVTKDTLVIAVSYSGNTEETLDGFLQAASRGAKLLAVTTGGELASLARKFQIPHFPINYGSEPRAAFGYLFTAVATILAKLRHLDLGDSELGETAVLLRALDAKLRPDVPTSQNLAKTLALKLKDKIPLIIGAGVMATVAKRWKTQMNENGKLAAVAEAMPELCHNVVVGMEKFYRQREVLLPIFLQSTFTHPRNQLRMSVVSRQFASAKLVTEQVLMHPSGTRISEAFQMILLGDYVSFYVGIQGNADPSKIDSIEDLKKELAQQPWRAGQQV